MKLERKTLATPVKRLVLQGAFLLAAGVSVPALAGLDVNIDIGAPPAPRVEAVPVAPAGYVWAPGFWEFFHGQYVWRRGHFIEGRPGYRWAPEVWDRRGNAHHFEEGHWERDPNYHDHHR